MYLHTREVATAVVSLFLMQKQGKRGGGKAKPLELFVFKPREGRKRPKNERGKKKPLAPPEMSGFSNAPRVA